LQNLQWYPPHGPRDYGVDDGESEVRETGGRPEQSEACFSVAGWLLFRCHLFLCSFFLLLHLSASAFGILEAKLRGLANLRPFRSQ